LQLQLFNIQVCDDITSNLHKIWEDAGLVIIDNRSSVVQKITNLWESRRDKQRRSLSKRKPQNQNPSKQKHSSDGESSQREPRASTSKSTSEAAKKKDPKDHSAKNKKKYTTAKEKVFDEKMSQVNFMIRWIISETNYD
jgi:hypothetical protein